MTEDALFTTKIQVKYDNYEDAWIVYEGSRDVWREDTKKYAVKEARKIAKDNASRVNSVPQVLIVHNKAGTKWTEKTRYDN